MIELLKSLFQALSPLWEMSLTAAYATVVVALLRLILKKRAPKQVLCLLWLVVFARLLIPVSLESPLSIVPETQQVRFPSEQPANDNSETPEVVYNNIPNDRLTVDPDSGGVTVTPISQDGTISSTAPALSIPNGVTPIAQPQPEAPAAFPWQALLAGIWLAGALAMCGYGLISSLLLRRRMFDAIRAEDGAWEHPSVNSPFILGMLRPKIYLPIGLYGQPRQFILCHEHAHLRRLDHIVKPLCWVALALHWFNPAVWIAFVLMSRDIEAACDEAVIRKLGPRVKADYSATLLSLATNGRVPAPCPLAFDEGDAKGRIKNVLRYRRPALWVVIVSALLSMAAAVCLLTDPVAAEAPNDPDPDPDSTTAQDPDPTAAQDPETDLNALLDPWMTEVLTGRQNFSAYHDGGEQVNIDWLNPIFYGEPTEMPDTTVGKFVIIDLDRDGIKELVVSPTSELGENEQLYRTGYLILRRQGDEVYGFNLGWRGMEILKADGTFHWSGGAFNWGTGSLRFTSDGFTVDPITWCDNNVEEHYYVNGLQAEKDAFDAAIDAQAAKPEPVWYVFADEQLRPWLPQNFELVHETSDRDAGEAKLWLEGGEIPWLEWNGSTTRLVSSQLSTKAQNPWIYCRDFDSDGQNEVVITYNCYEFPRYDLYEWRDGQPVLADSFNTEQLLLRFNQNNVAAVGADNGVVVTWSQGWDDTYGGNSRRVSIHNTLHPNFFDGYEQFAGTGTYHAYANQFYLIYIDQDRGNSFQFQFEFSLADAETAHLSHVDTPASAQYTDHYMPPSERPAGCAQIGLSYVDGQGWQVVEPDFFLVDGIDDPTFLSDIQP